MHNKIKGEILTILCDRVPNFVSEPFIQGHLKNFSKDEIHEELKSLVTAKIIEHNQDYKDDADQATLYFRLVKREGIPVRETIKIGNVEVPRLLSNSQPSLFPSVSDEQLESIAEFSQNLESRFIKMIERERQKLLANIVGVLGIIVSVLAMVIVGLPKIQTDPHLPFLDVVFLNLAQLLPLAIALSVLVFLLWWVVRGKNR